MPKMNVGDFVTADGVRLIDLKDRRCWIISGNDVTEREVHTLDCYNGEYAICTNTGNGYFKGKAPESCLYADPQNALRKIIENLNTTHNSSLASVISAMEYHAKLAQPK